MGGEKIIFGFVGQLASGKGAAVKYLEKKYNAGSHRFSTMLRDALDRFYLEHSRNNLVRLSEIMRATFGEDIMAKTIVRDVKKDAHSLIVVDGIRRPADIVYLEKLPNFVLVEIFAAPQTRYRRLVQRGENADDKNKTYKQFLADNRRSTEISILQVIKKAKEKIDNNGDEKKLQKQLNALVAKYSPS